MTNQPPQPFPQVIPNGDYGNFANVNLIQSQQAIALESAKQGHVVVPASSSQAGLSQAIRNPTQDHVARREQQEAHQSRMQQANRQGQAMAAAYPGPVQRQGQGFPNNPNAPNTPARPTPSTPRPALQSQGGGFGPNQNQPQGNELPNLNKGVTQNQSSQIQGGKTAAMARQPASSQKPSGEQPQPLTQQGPPRRPQQVVFAEQMKAKLASLPNNEERRIFMHKFRQHQAQVKQQSGHSPAQPPDLRGNVNQPGTNPQPAPNTAPPQQDPNKTMVANVMAQRPQPQHQFTPDQVRRMDALPFPPNILGNDHPLRPPKHIVTWGDLKSWTSVTAGLPPDSLQKLIRLQLQHASSQIMGQLAAPVAPMAPAAGFRVPHVPTPNDLEVQQSRNGFPNRLSHMSDDQIRQSIIWKRQTNWAQNELKQTRPPQYHAQVREFGNRILAQLTPLSNMMRQDAAPILDSVNQQPQPPPKVTTPRKQGPLASTRKTAQTPSQEKKGFKRQSTEDVSEVPDPRNPKQPPLKATSTPQQSTPMAPTDQQQPTLQARNGPAQGQNQLKNQSSQGAEQGRDSNMLADPDVMRRLQILRREVMSSMQPRRPVAITPQERAAIEQSINQRKLMFSKLQTGLLFLLKTNTDEERIKIILQRQLILLSQFRNQDVEAGYIDRLTISISECQGHLNALSHFMKECMQKTQMPPQLKGTKQQTQPSKEATPALSASNLQQQQMLLQSERQADIKKHHVDNRAPAAPTSAQSPYSFTPRPKSPVYGGPAQVTQDTLRIPEKKKRKPNTSAAPSPSVTAKASPQVLKQEPEVQRPKPAPPRLKCQSKGCESLTFVDQAALQKHHADNHMPVSIADPLAFSLEKMRNALGLDEKGKMKAKKADEPSGLEAPAMKNSPSMAASPVVKRETSGAAISRVASQVSGSPVGKLLEPPKGTTSGKLASRDPPRSSDGGASSTPKSATATIPKKAWSDALFDPIVIRDAFSALREPLALTSHLWQEAGEDPGLTSDSASTNNSPAGSKPTPSPRLSNTSVDPILHVDSMGALALGSSDMVDRDEFLNWYPEGWKEHQEMFGEFPPVCLQGQADPKLSIVDDQVGEGLISFDQYIADFGMSLEGMDDMGSIHDV